MIKSVKRQIFKMLDVLYKSKCGILDILELIFAGFNFHEATVSRYFARINLMIRLDNYKIRNL